MEAQENRLYTVKDFALQVGITSSAIYQQLNGRLKQYTHKGKGGKVLIEAEALQLYDAKQRPTLDKSNEALKSELERLRAEIEAKDQEIARLSVERDGLREQLAREQELSRERLDRALKAEEMNKDLIIRFPPQLPAGNGGSGLFGWFKRKKGDTTT